MSYLIIALVGAVFGYFFHAVIQFLRDHNWMRGGAALNDEDDKY